MKKRSIGVTIFAWLIIIVGVFTLLPSFDFKGHMEVYKSFPKNVNIGLVIYGILSSALGLIAGIGLLQLKEVMRKIAVAINLLDVLSGIPVLIFSLNDIKQYAYNEVFKTIAENNSQINPDILANVTFYLAISIGIFILIFSMSVIFFFTRPKVKEQFK